ncbi:MAG: SpoIIE family protein phosphatase [Bacteriovoracia bacterium]
MEQDQIKVSFSLGTKLLISVVLLLVIVIGFLALSFRFLITEDKRAYIYQVQGTQSLLAANEFKNIAQKAFDTLKQSLASVDPYRQPTERDKAALDNVIANQSELSAVTLKLLKPESGDSKLITRVVRKTSGASTFKDEDWDIKPEWFKIAKEELTQENKENQDKIKFAFFNLSNVGAPLLGIVIADSTNKGNPNGMPIAIGFIQLEGFLADLKGADITIANMAGWTLYDTDPEAMVGNKNVSEDPLFLSAVKSPVNEGAQEYTTDRGHFLGSFKRLGFNLVVMTRISWEKAIQSTYTLIINSLVLAAAAIGIGIVFALFFSKTLTAPLKKLYDATKEVAAGNFSLQLRASSRDEIGALSTSFNVMSSKISELIKESVEKVRIEGELAIASTVQQTLLPPPKFRDKNILIQSHYQSASECGGDWWGFFSVNNRVALFIADATGHGLPSALITASARSCFSVMHKIAQENPQFSLSPGAMLAYANRVVHDAASGKIMMTFFAGVIDFNKKTLTYASAGHNPPWLFKKTGAKFELQSLTAKGQRLGENTDVPPYEEKSIAITPGDVLFLYTDGIIEGKNTDGQMYGKKQMRNMINANLSAGPESIINSLIKDFSKHNGKKPLDDDITLAAATLFPG